MNKLIAFREHTSPFVTTILSNIKKKLRNSEGGYTPVYAYLLYTTYGLFWGVVSAYVSGRWMHIFYGFLIGSVPGVLVAIMEMRFN
jgi:hypothetical protein